MEKHWIVKKGFKLHNIMFQIRITFQTKDVLKYY